MTNEQQIRGVDAGFDWAVLVTGHSEDGLASQTHGGLGRAGLEERGATDVLHATYRLEYSLFHGEVAR